jgi:sarcosine oxidase
MPLLIDPSGVYCRPENDLFITARAPAKDNDPTTDSFHIEHDQFEAEIWPILAERVPAFEAIKVVNAWAGHYDVNTIDNNPVIGPHPTVSNFIFANGMSGHGLQKSPAVGQGISEHILTGGYRTIDLSDFRSSRFADGELVVEQNVF